MLKLSDVNCRVNLYTRRDIVKGTEAGTGTQAEVAHEVLCSLQPTGTQRTSTRQTGQLLDANWTAKIEPLEPGYSTLLIDVLECVKACFVNDPVGAHEGRYFDVAEVQATAAECKLLLRESQR
jgi:hypothetical protein